MIKRQNQNLVLTEKTIDFETVFSLLYAEACDGPAWKIKPDYDSYRNFVEKVHYNGNLHVLISRANFSAVKKMELLEIL